ncbi:MAG TPA: peptide-binding protein [Symbiobacteriaceae bacterium]
MKRKWSILVAGALALSLLVSACGGSKAPSGGSQTSSDEPRDGGTLTWSTTSDIITLNYFFINDTASQDVANLIYAYLYNVDEEGRLVVDDWCIASELPEVSEDGKTYTIKLKDTPKWSDGKRLTAEDVVFTLESFANKDVLSPQYANFDKIESVKALDERTVQVTLSTVFAPFETSGLYIQIMPKHAFEGYEPSQYKDAPFGKDPSKTIYSGPYIWTEWKQKQSLTFERNPNWWGPKKPHIDKIVYKIYADQNTEVQALLKGEVDLVTQIPVASLPAVEGKPGIKLIEGPGPVYDYLGFNFNPENWPDGFVPFAGIKTRQAIAHAINRQGLVDSVLQGHGVLLNGPFLPNGWAYTGAEINYEYNVEKAKQLLAEDGWTMGPDGYLQKDGHKFEFTLQFNTGNKRREAVAAIIQANLKEVGIKVNIEPLDFSSWIENHVTPGRYQAVLLGWSLSIDPDAESIFSSKFFPPNGQNSGWYKNEKVDELWVKGYSVIDPAERKKVYAELAKEITTDLPYVFLYQQNIIVGMRDRVKFKDEDKPVLSLPYGETRHIYNWWLSE